VTGDCPLLCERRAKPGTGLKALAMLVFFNRRGVKARPADRQEKQAAANFAGVFTLD
jgi:hypothetical protein